MRRAEPEHGPALLQLSAAGTGAVGAFWLRSSAASGPALPKQGGGCAVALGKPDSSAMVTVFRLKLRHRS